MRASIPLASLLLPCCVVFISLFSDLNRVMSEALHTSEVSVGVCMCTYVHTDMWVAVHVEARKQPQLFILQSGLTLFFEMGSLWPRMIGQ